MDHCIEKRLRSTTLPVTILVVFFFPGLALARLFRLVLAGLIIALALPMLAGLTALLPLSKLAALLTLLLHIVSHKASS